MPFLSTMCFTVAALVSVANADTSAHSRRMVSVMPGVSVEVLDWGGAGPPVVLLTGFGNTAHVYDDLAPRLARDFHVFGITRRGYGNSSAAPSGLTVERLADAGVVRFNASVRPSGAPHYAFLSHADDVYQRMRKFLLQLPR